MKLEFGIDHYLMSRKLSRYPEIGKWVSKILGTLNIGQYARADIFKRIIKKLPLEDIHEVLDLGCGQGEYSLMMARAFPGIKITSLDVEAERLRKINYIIEKSGLENIQTHHGMIQSIEKNECFDFIYSIDVFEHINVEEMPFKEVYNKLKPGGHAMIKMPNRDQYTVLPNSWFDQHNQWLEDEHIGQVFDLEDLTKRMEEEGFEVVEAFYSDGPISRLSWEFWFLAKKLPSVFQLALLPFLKALVLIDRIFPIKNTGNTIQVLAKKVK